MMQDLINKVLTDLTAKAEQAAQRLQEQPAGRAPERFQVLGESFPALSVRDMHEVLHKINVQGFNARRVLQDFQSGYRGKGPRGVQAIEHQLVEIYLASHPDVYGCATDFDLDRLVRGKGLFAGKSDAELWESYRIECKKLWAAEWKKATYLDPKVFDVLAQRPSLDREDLQAQVVIAHERRLKLGKKAGRAHQSTLDVIAEVGRRKALRIHAELMKPTPRNRLRQLQVQRDRGDFRLHQLLKNERDLLITALKAVGAVAGSVQKFGVTALSHVVGRLIKKGYSPEASLIALGTRLARALEANTYAEIAETYRQTRRPGGYQQIESWLDPFDFAMASGFGLDFEDHLREANRFARSHWKSIKKQNARLSAA